MRDIFMTRPRPPEHPSHVHHPPAARDELSQAAIGEVPATPQVQRSEEATACCHHAGHHVVVLDLQWQAGRVGDKPLASLYVLQSV